MKKIYKEIAIFALILGFMLNISSQTVYSAVKTPVKPSTKSAPVTSPVKPNFIKVSPLEVVNNVPKYLHKNITFSAEFVAFTSLGLDYKPAFKDGSKFIGILIRRPEASENVIPLSEMKIFISRETAEKNIDIEAGDKIKIEGTVFSDALGDPWIDVTKFTMLTHKAKTEEEKE